MPKGPCASGIKCGKEDCPYDHVKELGFSKAISVSMMGALRPSPPQLAPFSNENLKDVLKVPFASLPVRPIVSLPSPPEPIPASVAPFEGLDPKCFDPSLHVMFHCIICRRVLVDARQCKNGHMACLSCTTSRIIRTPSCAECSLPMADIGSTFLNVIADKIIGSAPTICGNFECTWKGTGSR